jgi:hypothetical protein
MLIRKAALCVTLCLLTSCGTLSSPNPLPPSLCTTVRRAPTLPDGAGIVQPVTETEKAATRSFLTWMAEVVSIGDENAARAETAKKACP